MNANLKPVTILMADDDEDDRLLARDALNESSPANDFHCVADGVELLDYLARKGKFKDENRYPLPSLILLDLNMPRLDGRQTLAQLKADPATRHIPVIIFTTSREEEDMLKGYELGAASYITKPVTFKLLVELMQSLSRYWLGFVKLPNRLGLEG
ncbi:MAG TPA: response regulator [Hyphomicrobiales bacterium]|nr:response regulator [Hyphomicrobiales bacterium]